MVEFIMRQIKWDAQGNWSAHGWNYYYLLLIILLIIIMIIIIWVIIIITIIDINNLILINIDTEILWYLDKNIA